MPRKKKAFEDDDYDPISAEVARQAAYAGRVPQQAERSLRSVDEAEPATEAATEPLPQKNVPRVAPPKPAPSLAASAASAADTGRRYEALLLEARQALSREEARKLALEERLRVLASEREHFETEVRNLREDALEQDEALKMVRHECARLRERAQNMEPLVAQLRWARIVSLGTLMVMVALTIWVVSQR